MSHQSSARPADSVNGPRPAARPRLETLRHGLLALLLFSMVGTMVELFLLEHIEDLQQQIPLYAIAAGALLTLAVWMRPGIVTVRLFQTGMLAFLVVGGIGVWLHYRGNVEFELEMYPTRRGLELFREAMAGATPTLAAGLMAQIGLLGLACTYAHPALAARPRGAHNTEETV